jgi:GrpB-like predicted nucleotidyltransferase (UPF0157 family)
MSKRMSFLNPSDYQSTAWQTYGDLKAKLMDVLPFAEVEHIGSSAILGAISKGDLDVLVRVAKNQFPQAIEAVESLGFSVKQGTLRTESLCMLEGPSGVAVQLIEKGSEFEMFVRFRDRMNSHPKLVEEYNRLKKECTGLSEDEYRERKSSFIKKILSEP